MGSVCEQGFEIVPEFLRPEALPSLIRSLEEASVRRSRAGIRSALQIPAVHSLAADDGLLQFAKNVLGKDAFPFRATLFEKSPKSNWLVVWHQDTASPLRHQKVVRGWGPGRVKKA
jgi:hypothetical protein